MLGLPVLREGLRAMEATRWQVVKHGEMKWKPQICVETNFQGSLHIGILLTTIFAIGQGDLSQFYDQVGLKVAWILWKIYGPTQPLIELICPFIFIMLSTLYKKGVSFLLLKARLCLIYKKN